MKLVQVLAPLLMTALIAGQAIVSPIHFTAAEGNSGSSLGIMDISMPTRLLQVHDDMQGHPSTIQQISFRRDGFAQGSMPAFAIRCTLRLSNAATTSASLASTFETNHGSNVVHVLSPVGQIVNLPSTQPGRPTRPFEYVIPFVQAFPFDGKAPLAWDLQITSTTAPTWVPLDAANSWDNNPAPLILNSGSGCRYDAMAQPAWLTGNVSVNWPAQPPSGTLVSSAGWLAPNAAAALLFGSDALQSPFLLPGSATAPSKACHLYIAVLGSISVPVDAVGHMSTSFPIPLLPTFNGANLFTQVVAASPAANPLGLITTDMVQHQFLAPYANVAVDGVWRSGSFGSDGNFAGNGQVVEFR